MVFYKQIKANNVMIRIDILVMDVVKHAKFNLDGNVMIKDVTYFVVMVKYNKILMNNVMIKILFQVMDVTNFVKLNKDMFV